MNSDFIARTPRRVGSINKRDVQGLVSKWSRQQAPRTVSRQYDVVRAIFNYAVDVDVLARAPCRNIKLPKASLSRRKLLTKRQLADLATAVGEFYGAMVYVGAVLGLRWGECAGLRVADLDFLARTVTVTGQRTRGKGGRMVEGSPKSVAGRRTLSAPRSLMDVLAAHLKRRQLTAADSEAYVFVGSRGSRSSTARFASVSGNRPAPRWVCRSWASTTCAGTTPRPWSATAWT